MKRSLFLFGLLALSITGAYGQLRVDVSRAKNEEAVRAAVISTAKQEAAALSGATKKARADLAKTGTYHSGHPISFPSTVWLTKNGALVPTSIRRSYGADGGGITLLFDSSGSRAFTQAYRDKLQSIFDSAQATMNSVFGSPSWSGTVAVKNYDADLPDRAFFSGGLFVPNAPGGPEIEFPQYLDDAATAVNFIHVLLLAYLGPSQYGFDAFNEGLVRAATMKIARTPAALPGYDQSQIGAVLLNSYEAGPWYDWYNQRALGGSRFVAPNLASQPLDGGVGGLYLLRYRMSGSAWQKVLAQRPGFIAAFNSAFYANTTIASNVPALVNLGASVLANISPGDPTVEGRTFGEWFRRQFILETKNTAGRKLLVQPVPFTQDLVAGEYAPFLIQANYFETLPNGNETLPTATSYPIFWFDDLPTERIFTDVQDDKIEITSAYGAIAPNLPDVNSGVPYRATIDVPVQDEIGRVYLPAGSIATADNPTPKDFYGTVTGAYLLPSETLRLQVSFAGSPTLNIPVTRQGAFGTVIGSGAYLGYATLTVSVIRSNFGSDTTLMTRTIGKGPGSLALDLRVDSDVDYTFPNGLPKGISAVGFPVSPWASYNPDIVGSSSLIARYDPSVGQYDLFPDAEPFKIGLGYFIRAEVPQSPFTVSGRIHKNISDAVSLRPGWNLVANPLTETVQLDHVRSVRTTDFAQAFTEVQGTDLGAEFFEFLPGPNDGITGAPETGSMIPASSFEPGKAYFVRVLAPEGVTLVFDPQNGQPRPLVVASSTSTLSGWRMGITLIDDDFQVAAQIGQSRTATSGFDPKEDSGLPPPPSGGRQVSVVDSGRMYRDVRTLGSQQVFTVRFDGLRAGKSYWIKFDKIKNSPGLFAVYRDNGSIVGYFQSGQSVPFRPTSASTTFKIKVSGGVGQ